MISKYSIRRTLLFLPTILGIFTVVFFLLRVTPGADPVTLMLGEYYNEQTATKLRQELELDKPLIAQYLSYLKKYSTGDFGASYRFKTPILRDFLQKYPHTLILAVSAVALALLIGVPIGVVSALKRNSATDYTLMTIVLFNISIPNFVFAIFLLYVFGYILGWVPIIGTTDMKNIAGYTQALVLPVVALGAREAAVIARITRSTMLEVMGQDYVRTARAKGLSELVVILRHTLRNALIPLVTVTALYLGVALGGTAIIETIFVRQGIGRWLVEAILGRDFPVVTAIVIMFALTFATINLVVDLTYSYLDPRIRLG